MTISANHRGRVHLYDRVRRENRLDPATAARIERQRIARENAERIAVLRRIVFRNAARNSHLEALTNEHAAANLLSSAGDGADGFLVLAVAQVAIDNRWNSVVQAGICYFGDHPVAARLRELWNLTQITDRAAV